MPSIVTKKINGKEYLYLVRSVREGSKVIQKTVKYIGKKRPIPKAEFECMIYSFDMRDWILVDRKDTLAYTEHHKMKVASETYKEYLKGLDSVSRLKEGQKFLSLFITSSNAIEGSTMTAKETNDYLFNEIVPSNRSKKELHMASNLLDAWNYLKENSERLPKNEDLFEMHKRVNKYIEDDSTLGKFKKVQNYIGDIYTSSYLYVFERMESLHKWIRTSFRSVDDFEVAFLSHAQFEVIHPFVDGNGRVGRLLLNWILIYKGHMPLAIRESRRHEYITALENTWCNQVPRANGVLADSRRGGVGAISQFCFQEYMEQYEFV